MRDGRFLKALRAVKPDVPTIVFVKSDDEKQEIAARSVGATAVLTEDASDELFLETIANVLGLKDVVAIEAIAPAKSRTNAASRVVPSRRS